MNITENILKLLKERRISITELAKNLDTTKQNLHRILNSNDIKASQLIKLSKALQIPVSDFFENTGIIMDTKEVEELKSENKTLKGLLEDKKQLIDLLTIMSVSKSEIDNILGGDEHIFEKLKKALDYISGVQEKQFMIIFQSLKKHSVEENLEKDSEEDIIVEMIEDYMGAALEYYIKMFKNIGVSDTIIKKGIEKYLKRKINALLSVK